MTRISFTSQALRSLSEAEEALRELVTQALEVGDYDAVARLADAAKSVALLKAGFESQSQRKRVAASRGNSEDGRQGSPATELNSGVLSASDGTPETSSCEKSASRSRRRTKKQMYPRFVRQGNILVKIGWSKKSKSEYEHRAPWAAVHQTGEAVSRAAKEHRLIRTEQLLPVTDEAGEVEVPVYQVYIALAWLIDVGLVYRHGRKGYTVDKPNALAKDLQEKWDSVE